MKILYLFSFIGLIFILPSLIFAVHTKSDSVAVDIPGNNFSPGWRRVGRLRIYKGHDLFNYIDGGAELFNEFGFEELNVQLYGNGTEEITLEIYRMKSTVAALGIYLIKKGEETPYPEILTRNSATPFQCIAVKNRYFIVVTNTSGSEDIKRVVISLINRIILTIPEGKKVDLLRRLPQKGRVKGTEIIIAGQYSTESVYTFGEGNILRLGGGVFGVAADYIDSQVQRTALINIQFLKDSCK